jgi:hypothetical protein
MKRLAFPWPRIGVLATALVLSACSTWNPLVALGIKSEPANKPTPLAPINSRTG